MSRNVPTVTDTADMEVDTGTEEPSTEHKELRMMSEFAFVFDIN